MNQFRFHLVAEVGFEKVKSCYLLFVGRTRRITQYAAALTADIDPDVCGVGGQVIEAI